MKRLPLLLALAALPLAAQSPTFEVATVKPAAPIGIAGRIMVGSRGGPGTGDPTRYVCNNCPLIMLITTAWNLKPFQVTAPAFVNTERFEITAKVPEGATKDQFKVMLQNLLIERFGMKFRMEKKEMAVYDLVVAKNAPKFKESTATAPAPDAPLPLPAGGPAQMKFGKDGFPEMATGRTMTFMVNGNAKHQAVGETMSDFAAFLTAQLSKPVTDSTNLPGKYDFTLTFAPESTGTPGMPAGGGGGMMVMMRGPGPGGPEGPGAAPESHEIEPQQPLQRALQDQLGLKLEQKKGQADILIIDHLEKTPTEN